MIDRRDVLKAAGLGALAAGLPVVSFAKADTDARFVLIILRGAVDGLAVAAPYGDENYQHLRGELSLPDPTRQNGLLNLDGMFGLHPSMTGLHADYRRGEALIVHAIASPYRQRSHFDGQDVLEHGGSDVGLLRNGWLNRAIASLGSSRNNPLAIAMSQNTPLVLRGDNEVTSWAPSRLPDASENTIARLQEMYADDEFFASRLERALKSQQIAAGMDSMDGNTRRGNEAAVIRSTMESTARFLVADDGPRIAVLEAGGWDTHANQGAESGALANRLGALDAGLLALQQGLGAAWKQSVVAVVTEFGRTVRVNGTRGTDHGTASAAILTGGAVHGGRVIADWPGLRSQDLYEGRDLRPTSDLRSLFKGVLADHLQVPGGELEASVFPDSRGALPIQGLIRS